MAYQDFVLDRPVGRSRARPFRDDVIRGGSQRGLAFAIEWSAVGFDGDLSFSLANEQVWSTAGTGLGEKLWSRFLEGLSEAWVYLLLEETYPHGVWPEIPSHAPALIEKQLFSIEKAQRAAETFRRRHDVAAWVAPERTLPSLWLMREGNQFMLEGGSRVVRWAYSDVVRTLRELGEHVAQRASSAGVAEGAVSSWRARDSSGETVLEQISMGETAERLKRLKGLPSRSRDEIFRGVDEVRAAARMLEGRVVDEVLADIVDKIRAEPRRDAPTLRSWSEQALEELRSVLLDSPRAQGRHIARWLRKALHNTDRRASPENLLAAWGVAVTPFPTARNIEAISFWGAAHGPAILRNPESRRSGNWQDSYSLFGGQRFTLAHELAHLLLDVDGAYPVAEVLGGNLPRAPEERANAFAAEFLLPEEVAGSSYQRTANVFEALVDLTRRFGVTRTLAAYQILKRFGENSPVLDVADFNSLREIVRPRRQTPY